MTFVFLVSFFKEMLNYSEKNKLTPEKICELLCECLIGEDHIMKKSSHRREFRESLVRAVALPKKSPSKIDPRMSNQFPQRRNSRFGSVTASVGGLTRQLTNGNGQTVRIWN
jgi:hypothetical protein